MSGVLEGQNLELSARNISENESREEWRNYQLLCQGQI